SYAVRTSGMTAEQIEAYDKNPLADPATAIGYYEDAAQIRNPVGPDGNPVLSGTLNLYAIWQKVDNYKVIFEPNGGTDVGDNNVVLRAPGTALNLGVYTPVRRGYVFGGWYRDPAFRTRFTAIGATTYTDITLYAKWTPLTYRVAYNMNYNSVPTAIHRPGKSGSMGVQSARYGTYITLNPNAFAIDGYKFLGWNTSPDMVSGTGYSDRDVVNILPSSNNQLITLYAVWGPVDHYEITLDATGGTLTNNPESQYQITGELVQDGRSLYKVNRTVGEKLPLGGFVPVRDGYTFAGWYRDPNYGTVVRDVATNIYSDITVYARWTPKNYKVAFYADAPVDQTTGKPRAASGRMNVITMKYGTEAAISRNAFAVKGHTFLGWSTRPYEERIAGKTSEEIEAYDSDALKTDDVQYTNGVRTSNIDIAGDIDNGTTRKLYGVWAKTEYSIVYNNVGGIDNSANPVSYNVDQEIILAEPENMGDTFLGWYSDARMTRRVTSIPKGSTGNKVFYAKWSKTQYTINYNLNCPDDNLAILDTTKTGYITSYDGNTENGYVLATATRNGYDFGGWYREAACRTAVGPIVSSPNIDMTVYARWIPHAYTIKFKSKTPDAPEDLEVMGTMVDRAGIKSGVNYVLPAVTYTAAGYTFDGWCTEDDFENRKYTNRATVKDLNLKEGVETDSVTLYAKWNIIEYNIIYELNGGINPVDEEGESINPDKYTIKTDTIVLQDPVKEGYKFEGWFTTKNFTANSKVTEIKKGSKVNLRLYAKWKYMYNSTYVSEVTKPDKRVDAATYNIIPNDGIDDTIAINNAIAAAARNYAKASNKAEANNTVYLPAGVYNV
ncbi:MAG: InlB B-repeat-containing protein, partial [Lachnospiraceae bacterium]|nr:InlB B-repeat-containing protein [Lachnospiraceae bacterium]